MRKRLRGRRPGDDDGAAATSGPGQMTNDNTTGDARDTGSAAPEAGDVYCSGCREWIDAGQPEGLYAKISRQRVMHLECNCGKAKAT